MELNSLGFLILSVVRLAARGSGKILYIGRGTGDFMRFYD
jgi:hypothetical protein